MQKKYIKKYIRYIFTFLLGSIFSSGILLFYKNFQHDNPILLGDTGHIVLTPQESLNLYNSLQKTTQASIVKNNKNLFISTNTIQNNNGFSSEDNINNFYNKLDIVLGNPKGSQTIIAFIDITSPASKDMFPVLETLVGINPNLKVIIKQLPLLSNNSILASRYVILANLKNPNNGKLFFASLLTSSVLLTPDLITNYLSNAGFDPSDFDTHLNDQLVNDYLLSTRNLAMELNINSIPIFLVKNKVIAGEQTVEYFSEILAEK